MNHAGQSASRLTAHIVADPEKTRIERRALAILEQLAEEPDNPVLRARMLAGEDPAVVERVLEITAMAPWMGAMPTVMPEAAPRIMQDPPERFGAFRFVAPIGQGGMGEVWRGERCDGLFEQTVAIKLIQPHLQVRAGEAFEAERRILARFEHPGIARLIDGGTTADGRACLVMEYVDGVTFDLACAPLSLARRVALFRQVASAVGYAHSKLVAHGDLKPSNILVDHEGRARLLDFGIARLVTDEASAFLLSGAVTSSFASPARLAGDPPSIADDIFALGRLLTSAIGDDADQDLTAIAGMASASIIADRYSGVPELLADIDRWEQSEPVRAMPRTASYVGRKFARRHWRALAAASLLAGALTYAGINYLQAQGDRIEASARFDDARGTARYLLFTLYDELAAHPDTLSLRRQVALTAQHYLDRLAQSRSTVPLVKIEAAQGLLRLSDVQGSPGMASLGEGPDARHNIETAIRLLAAQSDPAARRVLFEGLLDSAFLAQNGESDEKRAARDLASAGRILAADPGLSAYQKARFYLAKSSVDRWAARNDLAITEADQAIALLREDQHYDTLRLRSKVFERKADALFEMQRHDEAIKAYRASVAPLDLAVRLYPRDMEARRRLAHIQWNLATALMDYGDPKEALALLENAEAEIRKVMAFDPGDDDAKRRFDMFEQSRGETLVILGRLDEGFKVMQAMTECYRKAWLAKPKDPRSLRNYAVTVIGLADQQAAHQRLDDACANWREYLRLYGLIEASGHLMQQDRENGVARATKSVRERCS